MSHPKTILIEGYFYTKDRDGKGEYPDLSGTLLDTKSFKLSARRFKIKDLHVIKIERLYGSYINSIEVQGVIETTGSLIPFFITRQKAKKLQALIELERDPTDTDL